MLLATNVVMDNPDCHVYFSGVSYKESLIKSELPYEATERAAVHALSAGPVDRPDFDNPQN